MIAALPGHRVRIAHSSPSPYAPPPAGQLWNREPACLSEGDGYMELKGWLFRRGPPCLMVMLPSEQYLKLVLPARRTRARSERGPALEPQRATLPRSVHSDPALDFASLASLHRAKRETCESAQGSSRDNTYLHGQTTHLAREAGCLVPIRSLKARLLPRHYLGPVRLLA